MRTYKKFSPKYLIIATIVCLLAIMCSCQTSKKTYCNIYPHEVKVNKKLNYGAKKPLFVINHKKNKKQSANFCNKKKGGFLPF